MEQKRGTLARVGITLLNVPAPGLGLLRVGHWKLAAASYGVGLLLVILMFSAPPLSFVLFAAAIVLGLAAYPVSMATTWLLGRSIHPLLPWYARWYSIVGATLLSFGVNYLLSDESQVRYRSFFTPAEAMAPSLPTGDRILAYMRSPKELRRGDILLVRAPGGSIYVKRLTGLPGDEIAVTNGVVMINGKPVSQQRVGTGTITGYEGPKVVQRLREQFPGEAGSHEIYDDGDSMGDHFGPQRVQIGHVFLLGDNRDHAADSRFSIEEMGLEQLPVTDILGWPMYHSFGSSRPIGEAINRRNMR